MTTYKSRQRSQSVVYPSGGIVSSPVIHEYIYSQNKTPGKWNTVLHLKEVSSGSAMYYGNWYRYPDICPLFFLGNIENFIKKAKSELHVPLDFQKNDQFELIPFLFDLDDTIGMFTTKFMKSLFSQQGYGATTWGILPFVSDVKSILASVTDVREGIIKTIEKLSGKRVSRRLPIEFSLPVSSGRAHFVGAATISGFFDMAQAIPDDPSEAVLMLLDEIGLHLDLKTAWDVVPLSFMVDYFVPVGDILESLSPRGWFCPTIKVEGGWSLKGEITVELTDRSYFHGSGGTAKLFYRSPKGDINLPTRPPVIPEFQSPSFKELFNTWYLTRGRSK